MAKSRTYETAGMYVDEIEVDPTRSASSTNSNKVEGGGETPEL